MSRQSYKCMEIHRGLKNLLTNFLINLALNQIAAGSVAHASRRKYVTMSLRVCSLVGRRLRNWKCIRGFARPSSQCCVVNVQGLLGEGLKSVGRLQVGYIA